MAELGGQHPETDRNMRFADSGRTKQNDISALGEESPGSKFVHESPVDAWLGGEVEVLQALDVGEFGELHVELDCLSVPLFELAFEKVAQEMAVGPTACSCLLRRLVELRHGCRQAQMFEADRRFLFVEGAHADTSS